MPVTVPNPNFINSIMDLLSPRGLNRLGDKTVTISDTVRNLLIDKSKTFLDIQAVIDQYFTKPTTAQQEAKKSDSNFTLEFHAISKKNGLIYNSGDYKDSEYWSCGSTVKVQDGAKGDILFNEIFGQTFDKSPCDVSIFVSLDPYLSPAAANTENVEMFLNYIPPHVANQLVPYLEVEFRMNKTFKKTGESKLDEDSYSYLSTPSTLRFMLGSVDARTLSDADRSLLRSTAKIMQTNTSGSVQSVEAEYRAGMDLFLSPQSLTNMDTLKRSSSRLLNVKPFVPFMSIIDFSVQVLNAGAGAMAHKTAKLQLKVHDKARLSEISEFIRGPAGFGSARIWTSYGWLAPRNLDENSDEYSKFINETMHLEDCWQVKNAQFSFDSSGQVTLNLDLVGFGVTQSRQTSIKVGIGQYESYLKTFKAAMEEIANMSKGLLDSPLGPDARISQVLNAGAAGTMLPSDIKDPDKYISGIINAYVKAGTLESDAGTTLYNKLKFVLNPKEGKQQLSQARASDIASLIKSISGTDPFLANSKTAPKSAGSAKQKETPAPPDPKFFNPALISELTEFAKPKPAPQPKEQTSGDDKEIPRPTITIDSDKKIISFGKLFCGFALPAFLEANKTDLAADGNNEVQVIFYALNDECGPVSGQSVAEFPIDVERLVYAIDDALKAKNKNDLTIEEFLRITVANQFNDDRAIGYGMLSKGLFEPFNRDKPGPEQAKKNPNYESNMAAWQAENPGFRRPIIEMFVETAQDEQNTAARFQDLISKSNQPRFKGITRIHIYDKQNNPRKLFSQVVEIAGQLELGALSVRQARLSQRALEREKSDKAKAKQFQASLAKAREAQQAALASVNAATSREAALNAAANYAKLETPTGKSIPIERSLFGANGIRASLRKLAPTLEIGSNGTMIKTVSVASKTDDLMAAANLVNIMKPKTGNSANGSPTPPPTGLEGPGGLPIRTIPAQLSMTTMGCPAVRLYQQFFVDLGTGTSLDNLYTCTQISHTIAPGKFETGLTFAFSDGYGKFTAPPTLQAILKDQGKFLQKLGDPKAAQTNQVPPPAAASSEKPKANVAPGNSKPAPAGKKPAEKPPGTIPSAKDLGLNLG